MYEDYTQNYDPENLTLDTPFPISYHGHVQTIA